ncbi:MAG TPA: hypothetical protein VF920_12790 [Dongiaceae bacterium]
MADGHGICAAQDGGEEKEAVQADIETTPDPRCVNLTTCHAKIARRLFELMQPINTGVATRQRKFQQYSNAPHEHHIALYLIEERRIGLADRNL